MLCLYFVLSSSCVMGASMCDGLNSVPYCTGNKNTAHGDPETVQRVSVYN